MGYIVDKIEGQQDPADRAADRAAVWYLFMLLRGLKIRAAKTPMMRLGLWDQV